MLNIGNHVLADRQDSLLDGGSGIAVPNIEVDVIDNRMFKFSKRSDL